MDEYTMEQHYNARREALKTLASNKRDESAVAIVNLSDELARMDPKFKEYLEKRTEEDRIEAVIELVADEVYHLVVMDEYGDREIMEDIENGSISYANLIDMIRKAGHVLIKIADANKI